MSMKISGAEQENKGRKTGGRVLFCRTGKSCPFIRDPKVHVEKIDKKLKNYISFLRKMIYNLR